MAFSLLSSLSRSRMGFVRVLPAVKKLLGATSVAMTTTTAQKRVFTSGGSSLSLWRVLRPWETNLQVLFWLFKLSILYNSSVLAWIIIYIYIYMLFTNYGFNIACHRFSNHISCLKKTQ